MDLYIPIFIDSELAIYFFIALTALNSENNIGHLLVSANELLPIPIVYR